MFAQDKQKNRNYVTLASFTIDPQVKPVIYSRVAASFAKNEITDPEIWGQLITRAR